eukprot:Gb_38013 [translate_table: standard]
MEWDKKTSSSCWDWDNVMLFSSRETEEGMKEMNSVYASNSASGSSSGIPGVAPAAVTNSNNAGRGSASPSKDHQRPFSKEENNLLGRKPEEAKEPKQRDSLIDLKLGRRTDFEEDVSGKTMKSTTTMASSGPSKRPRSLMLKVQTPFCQVQGCNADLTSSKDYHKRHKVCEMHSKSSKARVAGLEQRFCQQCSSSDAQIPYFPSLLYASVFGRRACVYCGSGMALWDLKL